MVPRGSGGPNSSQKDWAGMDGAGKGDEDLVGGPLC